MDSALKQRLIGAAVLVVLAVIFLPMVLDGTTGEGDEAISLDVPAQPADGMRTEVVPLPPLGSDAPAPAVAAPAEDRIATVDANAPTRVDAVSGDVVGGGRTPADASSTSAPAAFASPTQADATPSASPSPAAAQPAPTPAPTPVASPVVTPPPAAPVATAPVAAVPTTPGGRFFISFGSYGQRDNATALVAQLEREGIRAYAEQVSVNGAPALRVRAGPYSDRARAEQARQLARAARTDLDPVIVDADPAPAPATPATPVAGGYAVQIGAFADQATANARRDRLRQGGFTAFVDSVRTEQGTLWRVRVGPETARADAERLRTALKSRLAIDGQVVVHP
jgi:DedD protein